MPDDGSVTNAKVAPGAAIAETKLALASDAAAGTASRRTIGTGALQAASGATVAALDADLTEAEETITGLQADIAAARAAWLPLADSVETMPRLLVPSSNVNALATQRLVFMFFVAPVDVTVSKFKLPIGGTAAAGITLARMGLYTAPNPDGTGMTCVAASANTTTLGNATFTTATANFATNAVGGTAMPTSYTLTRGTRYAAGILFVGSTMPILYGAVNVPAISTDTPRVCGSLASQTDLPLSPGAPSNTVASVYLALSS